MMIVPLTARGRALGALTLATAESGRIYTRREFDLALEFAARIAMTMDNARLFDQARAASAARDATLAVVAHDLRNPLQTILLWTATLTKALNAPEGTSRTEASLAAIERAARRMNRLIRDLVDVSSIEAGRFSVEAVPQSLEVLVRASLDALRPTAEAKSLRLGSELPEGDELEVKCDRDRIEQLLGNLIGNAIKFTDPGGTIVVAAERCDGEVRVSVVDSGPGITPSQLPHVFDRYWQAPETARLGHGLGLAIAKGIVDAHHGRIWVESQMGVGTTFHFTLPAVPT
jgi:signal transduction histidine kinase